jgi:hypothetical protein
MGPVELLFFTIGFMFVLLGFARGYAREVSTTILVLVLIFFLTFFEQGISGIISPIGARLFGISDPADVNLLLSMAFSLIFISILFANYSGKTLEFLTFTGTPAPAPLGTILNVAVGVLNGYLVAGTLWYYQDRYNYPIREFVLYQDSLTETAQQLIPFLPPRLFQNPAYWMIPVAILLFWRVRG